MNFLSPLPQHRWQLCTRSRSILTSAGDVRCWGTWLKVSTDDINFLPSTYRRNTYSTCFVMTCAQMYLNVPLHGVINDHTSGQLQKTIRIFFRLAKCQISYSKPSYWDRYPYIIKYTYITYLEEEVSAQQRLHSVAAEDGASWPSSRRQCQWRQSG